ncbi:hypothetical protein [Ammoniphilus sp. CFH 90114]|uniref:hypothetical protein n=1 Tax=Ammoniphilus sp. CFH 90114 TaxID=2493665 RepID=UPI00100F1CB6|nr:hypothetical protein [Ammoniphilus sp. CFH 90114]RXT04328.1 hypothetical protein EIZ39_20840 [Ammoniphilus sp. CFH 90114]
MKKGMTFFLSLLLMFSLLTPAGYAQDQAVEAVTGTELKVSNHLISMTETREIEVELDFGKEIELSELRWTFGGKPLQQWKKWDAKANDYKGHHL